MKKSKDEKYIIGNIYFILAFILSGAIFTLALSFRYRKVVSMLLIILSIAFLSYIGYKFILNKKFEIKKSIISYLLSLYTLSELSMFFEKRIYQVYFLLASLAVSVGIYFFIDILFPKIVSFFKNLSKKEKTYLIIITIIGIIVSNILTNITGLFTVPQMNNYYINFDTIYKADNGIITRLDAFANIFHQENDIRQPFFAIFSLPFALVGRFISYFVIASPTNYKYAIGMGIVQYILLGITTILIGRMLKLDEYQKPYYYMFTSVTFSYLIFSNIIEQYVISLFYLVLTCYLFFNKNKKVNYAYLGAVGTLITSGIIFPLISGSKKIKDKVLDILKCFIAFIGVSSITGILPVILNAPKLIGKLSSDFGGATPYKLRLYQFTNFIENIFVTPKGQILLHEYQEYALKDFTSISIIGIIILILCILGYIYSRKNKFNLFCLLWIAFSFVILFLLGWGSNENCFILYSLYFGFAYISLVFNFIKGIFTSRKSFRMIIHIVSLIILCFNIITIIDILKFAVSVY